MKLSAPFVGLVLALGVAVAEAALPHADGGLAARAPHGHHRRHHARDAVDGLERVVKRPHAKRDGNKKCRARPSAASSVSC